MIDKFDNKYAFLSNFYYSPISPWADNIVYPTVEHAFQAMKSLAIEDRELIAKAPSPGKAKFLGRRLNLRPDWREVRINIMYEALNEKFKDPKLRELLLATGDEKLVEGNYWNDTYWGVCNGIGENHLGKLLMEVRDEIKNEN